MINQGRLPAEFRNRTKVFAAGAIRLYVKLPKQREEVKILGKQLLRSGTSVAAHVREASRARSNEEFVSKLGGALQEADETQMWLELLREECGIAPMDTLPMEKEADELMAIMTTMINRTKGKNLKIEIWKAETSKDKTENTLPDHEFLFSVFQMSAFVLM